MWAARVFHFNSDLNALVECFHSALSCPSANRLQYELVLTAPKKQKNHSGGRILRVFPLQDCPLASTVFASLRWAGMIVCQQSKK